MSTANAERAQALQDHAEIVGLFQDASEPVLTSIDVADELDITQQAAYKKLRNAKQDGVLKKKKVGSHAVVWWIEGISYDVDFDSESE